MEIDLNKLFTNEYKYNDFEIRKKIFELTNDLNLDLLTSLYSEFLDFKFDLVMNYDTRKEAVFNNDDFGYSFEDIIDIDNLPSYNFFRYQLENCKIIKSKSYFTYSLSETDNESVKKHYLLQYLIIEYKLESFESVLINFLEKIISENEISIEIPTIDLSDTTATEKIIYLQKLGVIDFLRNQQPFSTSVNSLATILSGLTGEKSGTIQPMLNAMLGRNIDTKNNPLNSHKPTAKVEQQLLKIGFKLK
jgi:hypothetical protein